MLESETVRLFSEVLAGAGPEDLEAFAEQWLVELGGDVPGDPRFCLLHTVREYALAWIVESGHEYDARATHACYFLHLALEASPHLTARDQVIWLSRLVREPYGLRGALLTVLEEGDAREAVDPVWWLRHYWRLQGQQHGARRWMEEGKAQVGDTLVPDTQGKSVRDRWDVSGCSPERASLIYS